MYPAVSWRIYFGPNQTGTEASSHVDVGIVGEPSDIGDDVWTWIGTILEVHGEHSDPEWIGIQFKWKSHFSPSFPYEGRPGTHWMGQAFAEAVQINKNWLGRYEEHKESS